MKEKQQHWVTRIQSGKAYRSVHGNDQPPRGGGRSGMDWKTIVGAIVVMLIVVAGVVVAVRSVDSATGWLNLQEMKIANDEAFVYLLLQTSGQGQPDWNRVHYRIAIDTYDRARGVKTLPAPFGGSIGSGAEFLIDLGGPESSQLLAVQGYDPFDGQNPIYSRRNETAFTELRVQTNRERFARNGRYFPPVSVHRGALRFASVDGRDVGPTTADVATGDGAIEIRIPWSLLNVTDPSSRTVLHSLERGREDVGVVRTEGFRFYAFSYEVAENETDPADRIPTGSGSAPLFRWEPWERPSYRTEPKLGVELVREAMHELTIVPVEPEVSNLD